MGTIDLGVGYMRSVGWVALVLCMNLQAADALLSSDGYGQVRFGAPLAAAETALHERASIDNTASGNDTCAYASFKHYPNVQFMIENGVVTRADITGHAANTLRLTVGMPLAQVARAYPAMLLKPHPYVETGHYVVLPDLSGAKAFVLEEMDGKIASIRAGLEPSVEYIEGCL
jgi:hypothetical protein